MKREQLLLLTVKLTLVIVLIVNIGTVFEMSGYSLVKSKIIIQPVLAQEKTLDGNSMPEWKHEELSEHEGLSENVPVSSWQAIMNIIDFILGFGANISILIIIYGLLKYAIAVIKEQKEKEQKAQKIIICGIIIIIICALAYAFRVPTPHPAVL